MSRPHLFVENRGQVHGADGKPTPQVLYHLSGKGLNISLTSRSIHYTFFTAKNENVVTAITGALHSAHQPVDFETLGLDVTLEGANPSPTIIPEEEQAYYENFYTPGCGADGATNVRSYARVVYHDVYPKIDWVVYVPTQAGSNSVKYDFVVHPGGDPGQIRMKYNGPAEFSGQADGSISIKTVLGSLQEEKPYTYIRESGAEVTSSYRLTGNELSFNLSAPAEGTLIIDPRIVWSTYFGGTGFDACKNSGIMEGNIYVCGVTTSTSGLATFGSHQSTYSAPQDAFLARFSPAGSLAWATYYGGPSSEQADAIAMDTAALCVYLCGMTSSTTGIATTGSHKAVANASHWQGFIARFRSNGTRVWGTYYGGYAPPGGTTIYTAACDAQGRLYVGGVTVADSGIATPGTHKPSYVRSNDSQDVFIAKFDTSGNRLWGTYFGGPYADGIAGICTDRNGNLFATGLTYSSTGIATTGAHQTVKADTTFSITTMDAYLAKFTPSGGLVWSTYYGSSLNDVGQSVTCDSVGNVYLCGVTESTYGMSTTGAHQVSFGGGKNDAFIAKFSSNGVRRWSTYFGGSGYESVWIGIPASAVLYGFHDYYASPKWSLCYTQGNLWLSGSTSSKSNMVTPNGYKLTLTSGVSVDTLDAFIAEFDSAGARIYGSYFGGLEKDYGTSICGENGVGIYLTGMTESPTGIANGSAFSPALNGGSDGFLLHLTDSIKSLQIGGATPSYCAGATFILNASVGGGGTMLTGNIFRVQLSNATGSFSAPTVIGTRGSVIGGTVTCTLPAGVSGTGYKLRIVSTNPVVLSDTAAIIINPLPQPTITYSGGTLSTGVYTSYQWLRNGTSIPGASTNTYTPTANGQYTVRVALATGCMGTSAPYTITGVGVNNAPPENGLKVYPNPAYDVLIIEGAAPGMRATLSNMLGQQVAEIFITAGRQEIPLAALPQGVYLLHLSHPHGAGESIRILKQWSR